MLRLARLRSCVRRSCVKSRDGSESRQRVFAARPEISNKKPPKVQKLTAAFAKIRSRIRAAIFKLARRKEKSPLLKSPKETRPSRSCDSRWPRRCSHRPHARKAVRDHHRPACPRPRQSQPLYFLFPLQR